MTRAILSTRTRLEGGRGWPEGLEEDGQQEEDERDGGHRPGGHGDLFH